MLLRLMCVYVIQVPALFSGRYQVMTEMGRSLLLKAGTSLTRVEHIKVSLHSPSKNPDDEKMSKVSFMKDEVSNNVSKNKDMNYSIL